MGRSTLPGQASWLQFLSTLPDPASAFAALVHGPLHHYGARAGGIWKLVDGENLERLTLYGHSADEISRHGRIPLRLDFAITRAVRSNAFRSAETQTNARDYRAAALDESMWQRVSERLNARSIGNAPIRHDGRVIGAYGFICDRYVSWTEADETALLGIGSALGLWLTHPQRVRVRPAVVDSDEPPVALTQRQEQVLLLVEQGMPTESIAESLRYSISTIKADLGHAMRVLRTDDREVAASRARSLGLLDDGAHLPAAVAR